MLHDRIRKFGNVHEIPLLLIQCNINGLHKFRGLAIQVYVARNVQVRHAQHDQIRIQTINDCSGLRMLSRMLANVLKQLVLAFARLITAADNDFGCIGCIGCIGYRIVFGQFFM